MLLNIDSSIIYKTEIDDSLFMNGSIIVSPYYDTPCKLIAPDILPFYNSFNYLFCKFISADSMYLSMEAYDTQIYYFKKIYDYEN